MNGLPWWCSPDVRGRLDELDFVAGLEGDDRLLVVGTDARTTLAALLVFAAVVLHVHATNGDLEGLFNSFRDRVLVGRLENFKGILAELGAELVGLLRESDVFEDAVGL